VVSTQVAPVRTPISASDLYDTIAAQWPAIVGGEMPRNAGVMLVAQSSLETGAWHNCWNGNVGNLAGTTGSEYTMLHASDGNYRPYRAYDSLFDGIADWLRLMKREPGALAAAANGDVNGFVNGLVAGKYFEEAPASYLAGMQNRFRTYANSPLGNGPDAPPDVNPIPVARLAPGSFLPAVVLTSGLVFAGYAALKLAEHLQTSAKRTRRPAF
jgi:hypothetical protein